MHISVLLHESIDGLDLKDGDVVFDGTFGGGGHSRAMLASGKDIKIIATDLDLDAVNKSKDLKDEYGDKFIIENDSFSNIISVLKKNGISKIDKALLDLGWSSNQLESGNRGLSFQKDEPLLMTLKSDLSDSDITAREVVNTWSEETLADIIYGFGEEKYSRRIARGIVESREVKPIETTFELVDVIQRVVPKAYRFGKIHPATRTFQAIRIAVNRELDVLEKGLADICESLSSGGRLAVISFHSLEDRIVKRFFIKMKEEKNAKILTKKPTIATKDEMQMNPRSRSAKLRIIEIA